jgi:hypothetical protein
VSPIPELPPITEDATLDASRYVAALEAMAAAAQRAANANDELVGSLAALQGEMDSMAAGAAEAASAEEKLGEAEKSAAAGASGAAAAEENLAKANTGAASSAFSLAKFQQALTAASLASAAAGRAAANAADASRDAYAGLAAAEAAAAAEAQHLAAAEAAGSLAGAQDAQMAKALAEADVVLAAGENLAADAAERQAAALLAATAGMGLAEKASLGLAASSDGAGAAATRAGIGFRFWGIGMALTRNALHWIVAGAAEFLAVAIPATIALAAGLAVAAQGAQNAQQHFTALYAATESTYAAFHQTVGSVLGLGSALQNAQNAADPGVYTILGSAVNDMRTHFAGLAAAGLQVVHMFDEFSARVTVDLQQGMGAQIQGLLSRMVTDLQQFGQVLGNLGHALLNFASAMPGLANVLLTVAVGLSEVVMWASRGGSLLTFAFAMEEVFRWGGLVLSLLVRMTGQMAVMNSLGSGGFLFRFGAALITLVSGLGRAMFAVGAFIAELDILPAVTTAVGNALAAAGVEVDAFAAGLSANMVVGIIAAAAALTFLVAKLASMKDATQQWVASSDQMIAKASDLTVLPKIYGQLADTTTRLAASQGTLATQTGIVNARFATGRNAWQGASTDSQALASHLQTLVATADTVRSNINLLAGTFHTSSLGALALANAAGVNLQVGLTAGSTAAKIAVQQINNLKAGLGAMAAPASVIGADMEAVGVQSQLASSKVQQVNQAMDAFIGATTGGMNSIMQFNGQLRQMGHDGLSSSVSLTGAINSISRSAAKMGFDLQGIGPKAQQSWQQFDAAVQQGNTVLDTFRTGMAEGVVTQQQYATEIRAVGGALLPFAAGNRTALAIVSQLSQQLGGPASTNLKTLASQFGITGRAAQNMATTGMEQAIARMANLNVVARNLSATVSGQLDAAMSSAIVKASGLDGAYLKWASDVKGNAAPKILTADLAGIDKAQNFVNTATARGTTLLNGNSKAAQGAGAAFKGAAANASDLAGKVQNSHLSLMNQAISAKGAMLSTQGFGQEARTAAGTATGLATNASGANTVMKALGASSNATRGSLGTVNNEIRATAGAASGAVGPLGSLIGNISRAGSAASSAAGQVYSLASAINSLHSTSVTITTNMVTTTSTIHRQHGGPVFPGVPYTVGEAGRELFIPSAPGTILPHGPTEQALSGGSGGQNIHLEATIPVTVTMDGKPIFQTIQREAWRWSIRNTGQPGNWVPGGG